MTEKALQTIEQRCALAIDLIGSGIRVGEALRKAGISETGYYEARKRSPALQEAHAKARIIGADDMVDRVPDIVLAEESHARARVIMETFYRHAALVNPRRYGNQLNLAIEERPSMRAALEMARLRSSTLPIDMVEKTNADGTSTYVARASDCESVDPELLALFSGY